MHEVSNSSEFGENAIKPLTADGLDRGDAAEHLIRTLPSQLKTGHMVARLDIAWSKTPYPDPTGLLLESPEQKQWMVEHCRWVIIDLRRSRNLFRPPGRYADPIYEPLPAIPDQIRALQDSRIGPSQLRRAWALHRELNEKTALLLQTFQDSARLDMAAVNEVVRNLADALDDCLAGLVWLTRIKEAQHYTAQHVVNTAILSMGLTFGMRWRRERIETAGQVGMLHDIGKARLDHALLDKAGPLSDSEIEEVRRHVIVGFDLLKSHPDVPMEVASAVRSSHERPDGSGYPHGLNGNAIPVMARLIAVVDAYDAITSVRPHGAARSHQRALGELWRARGSQFEPALVEAFIQFLGWVPPGTLVRLVNDELGVVMNMRSGSKQRPVVRSVRRVEGQLVLGPQQELAAQFEDDDEGRIGIRDILPDGAENISMRALTGALMRLYEAGEPSAPDAAEDPDGADEPLVSPGSRWRFSGLRKLFGRRPDAGPTPPVQPQEPVESVEPSAALRRRILVIDDSSTVRETLSRILEQSGHEVETADSGEQGLERACAQVPELIFLDILLPGINGFATLRQLRKDPAMADVPVVMISGNPQATDQFFLGQIGADDFLPKPFAPEDVGDCLARLAAAGRLSTAESNA
ncbi:response regulator [Wenzhouxiangella sp. C33]|uniref:Response regulator n=1 Tax=Wenzhouxiangella limi TaxID=2707351 RepID=A0A845UZB9_9GAMM|nr:response regulator [Wenzhouxiangella limi]